MKSCQQSLYSSVVYFVLQTWEPAEESMQFMIKIIASYRLEKTFKILESSPALPIRPLNRVHKHKIYSFLNISKISEDILNISTTSRVACSNAW